MKMYSKIYFMITKPMPKGEYFQNRLLYIIWEASDGTGVMPLKKWAYRDVNGKVIKYRGKYKMRPIYPVLEIIGREKTDLSPEAKALFEREKNINLALQYTGDLADLAAAKEYMKNRHKI